MLIMASGGSCKPLDYGELERCTRAGYGIGARSNGRDLLGLGSLSARTQTRKSSSSPVLRRGLELI
jgi:hypothetical protein